MTVTHREPIRAGTPGTPAPRTALEHARLLRGERVATAAGGLLGVAVAAGLVARTGSTEDFFVIGIWASLAGLVVTLGSVLARRPLTGVVGIIVRGGAHAWRSDRVVLRAHDVATLAAAAVCGSRSGIGRGTP